MSAQAFVSVMGNVSIALALGAVVYFSSDQIDMGAFQAVPAWRFSTLPLFFGVTMFGKC